MNIIKKLSKMNPYPRRILLILIDFFIIYSSIFISFWLSSSFKNIYFFYYNFNYLNLITVIGELIYIFTGQYKSITKYVSSKVVFQIALRNLLFVFIILLITFKIEFISINDIILFWIVITTISSLFRIISRSLLRKKYSTKFKLSKNIAIYGAGEAGAQLLASINLDKKFNCITFIDDNPTLWKRNLDNIPITSPENFLKIKDKVDTVLIAIPSLSREKMRSIVNFLQSEKLSFLKVPSLEELSKGDLKIDSFKPIIIEDLLGRESITPKNDLLGEAVNDLKICITGAGGSIGSELCKQISSLNPEILVLVDFSESSLYKINYELENFSNKIKIIPIIGDVNNRSFLKRILVKYDVEIIFHAAAYKHVPLVESNALEGIKNNVFSSQIICSLADELKLKKVIFISTDKAVRPTNIMGASKRLSEIVVLNKLKQIKAEGNSKTKFALVRFGNVLGSSGSVVPLFKNQIMNGGPITLTHKDVIRYFMTIEEAAQLVIQASAITSGGEIFLLDMGEPIKIFDLAKQMINLSGLEVKDNNNPNGDIEIKITGLRPGEKLYEELLVDNKSEPTIHPLIYKSNELLKIETNTLESSLKDLKICIENYNEKEALKILSLLIPEWDRSKKYDV